MPVEMLAIISTHPIQYQVPLWQALAKDGRVRFEVWYLTDHGVQPSHDRGFGKSFAWDIDLLSGYPLRFLKLSRGAGPSFFWRCRLGERLRERLRHIGAKALWIQGWQVSAYWQAVWEAKAAGVEVWLRGESNDLRPSAPSSKQSLKRVLHRQLFERVDRFLYIGSANKRFYEKYGVLQSRLYPAPYAVDNERFRRQAAGLRPQRAALRRAWGIPDDAFCVLFCGKFIAKKRPMDLVSAARLLRSDGRLSSIHLLFAGSGELGDQLRHASRVVYDAEKLGHLPNFDPATTASRSNATPSSFPGFLNQTEISRAYVAADCLVLPSDPGETWGLVVNEALASGLPCIVSDACGCSEDMIKSSDPSLCFPCGDVTKLANAIMSIRRYARSDERFYKCLSSHSFGITVDTVVGLSQPRLCSEEV
jgi:glycosyltransferase involved in cell wall biosynthesis